MTQARPDFFHRLSAQRGIIAEVERGGAVNNNHDLKDVWKAHIAPDAQHLFLVVPNSNCRGDGSPREKPFMRVSHRAASFFGDSRREIDVLSLHVFGYGRSSWRPDRASRTPDPCRRSPACWEYHHSDRGTPARTSPRRPG